MKRKFVSVLLALVLVLSFSLVTAVPVAAATTFNVYPFTLQTGTNAAAWSTVQEATGSYSVLLNYVSGDNSYVEFTPATGTTIDDLETIADGWSWWYYFPAATGYGPLLELRFTSGDGHIDITVNTAEATHAHDAGTTKEVVAASTCIYFGNDSTDETSFYNNTGSVTLAGVEASIDAQAAMIAHSLTSGAWALTRVRVEIGWAAAARTCYIDDIEINNVTYYGHIQDTVDAASTGDTISVTAGTYESDSIHVHTQENLTIESVAGANTTIISGATGTNKLFEIGGHSGNTADGFTLDGFTLSGYYEYGVYLYVRGFDIKNNVILNTRSDGIFVTNPSTGPPTAITSGAITNNTITGKGADILNLYRPGILLECNDASGAQINGITITNNTVTGFGTTTVGTEACGIKVASVEGKGVVSDITITGNTASGNYLGLSIYGACTDLDIYSNTITANNQGVNIVNSGTTAVSSTFDLYRNTITNNTGYGVNIVQAASEALSGVKTIKYNDITGNGAGIKNDFEAGTAPVAKYNYWGDPSGPTVTGNDRGTGDTVTATYVTYDPWLHTTQATVYPSGVRYYAYNWCDLTKGWNIWSTPIALDAAVDTWGEYKALGNDLDLASGSNAYYFTSSGTWASVTDSYSLTPCDALYIKMASDNTSPILFSSSTSVPSKTLVVGWNLVSASYIDVMNDPTIANGEDPETVLASVFNVPGPYEIGYSQVVSPAVNQGTAWSGVRLQNIDSAVGGTNDMLPCKGYWVYMTNAGTLAGTVFTPVSPLQ